jgi:hypothetical protein
MDRASVQVPALDTEQSFKPRSAASLLLRGCKLCQWSLGRVVTSRKKHSRPAVTRLACKKLSTPWAGIASLELIVAPRGVLPIVCRIGRGLPDASTLTTPPGARQLIRMTHRNVCAILHHQHIRRSLIHKSSHPLRRNGSQRFPQAKTVIFHR